MKSFWTRLTSSLFKTTPQLLYSLLISIFPGMGHQQFAEVYKTWSDFELFQLLQNKDDYQEEAIEAASAEMNARKLSEKMRH